jgi:phospholipase C
VRYLDPTSESAYRHEVTRRKVLQAALASAAAAAAATGLSACTTQSAARAKGHILPPGTRPDPSRPEGAESIPQIEHIVIYMNENHSFDSYYGVLGRGDGYRIGRDGKPVNYNLDANGRPVRVFHQSDPCSPVTGDHSWNGEHIAWNHGKMDGFIRANGGSTNIMGYYDANEIPFYYGLAKVFPIADRWFSSVMGPTHPNRRYLQAATSAGMVVTSTEYVLQHPTAPNGTIWDRLDAHGISWKDYMIDGIGDIDLWPGPNLGKFLKEVAPHSASSPNDFLADCRNGTLPQVSIIAPGVSDQYDEGARDIQNGEVYSYSIINAVMDSPLWHKTVLFFTYDESGGCYDHVPPPPAVAPDNIPPDITVPPDQPGTFAQYGIRVPGFVISPYARKNYVSHVVHDHTSILKFIETKWNLGAMTYRDANADNLMDMMDFRQMSFPEPIEFPLPGLPASGSPCEYFPRPPVNPIPKDAVSYKKLA